MSIPTFEIPPSTAFCGRAQERLAPGDRVLLVTEPGLVYGLLADPFRVRLGGDMGENSPIGFLDAAWANPRHGVFPGTLSRCEAGVREEGHLWRVEAEPDADAASVFATEGRLREAAAARKSRPLLAAALTGRVDGELKPFILAFGLGADPEAFAKDHPWLQAAGLAASEEALSCLLATDKAMLQGMIGDDVPGTAREFARKVPGFEAAWNEALPRQDLAGELLPLLLAAARALSLARPAERLYAVIPDTALAREALAKRFEALVERTRTAPGPYVPDEGVRLTIELKFSRDEG